MTNLYGAGGGNSGQYFKQDDSIIHTSGGDGASGCAIIYW